MPSLSEIIAKARGLTVAEKPAEERRPFKIPPPTERCHCGCTSFLREPTQDSWSCLACELRAGRKFPLMSEQEGWQGHIVGYE